MMSTMRATQGLRKSVGRGFSSAAPKAEPSLLDSIFRRSSMPAVNLRTPFPKSLNPAPSNVLPVLAAPQVTTLDSGLRVVTVDNGSPLSSVGVFVAAGSRYEQPGNNGISNFLEHVAFKSTKNRSDFELVRSMLKEGSNVMCSTSREHTLYSADCFRENVGGVVSTLGDVLQNQAWHENELKEAAEAYAAENEERKSHIDVLVMEAVHAAAYSGNTLGHSLYAPTHNLASFTPSVLSEWTSHYFTPSRMVVSAVGVDHSEFVNQVKHTFTSLPKDKIALSSGPKAEYTGGDVRNHRSDIESGLTHFALAFETASWTNKDLVPMCVLQMMMGGGGSFSAGGPGKGMYSRLYEQVLNRHGWVESATSFNSIFEDSALFGIYGTCSPSNASDLTDVLSQAALNMAGDVDAAELARAKNQLKSAVHMQLETRAMQLEDIGRQLMIYGRVKSAQEMCAEIDAVTATQLKATAAKMLKTVPSVAAIGDLSYLPRYDVIAKRFG